MGTQGHAWLYSLWCYPRLPVGSIFMLIHYLLGSYSGPNTWTHGSPPIHRDHSHRLHCLFLAGRLQVFLFHHLPLKLMWFTWSKYKLSITLLFSDNIHRLWQDTMAAFFNCKGFTYIRLNGQIYTRWLCLGCLRKEDSRKSTQDASVLSDNLLNQFTITWFPKQNFEGRDCKVILLKWNGVGRECWQRALQCEKCPCSLKGASRVDIIVLFVLQAQREAPLSRNHSVHVCHA